MDESLLLKYVMEEYQRQSFTANDLYDKIHSRRGCPSFEELDDTIQKALKNHSIKMASHIKKGQAPKYRIANTTKSVSGVIQDIHGLLKDKKSGMAINEVVNELSEVAFCSRVRSVISILNALGIIEISSTRPLTIVWLEDVSNFYYNKDGLYSALESLHECQIYRNKLRKQLTEMEKAEEAVA